MRHPADQHERRQEHPFRRDPSARYLDGDDPEARLDTEFCGLAAEVHLGDGEAGIADHGAHPALGQASRRSGGRFAERQQHAALDVLALQGGAGEQHPICSRRAGRRRSPLRPLRR